MYPNFRPMPADTTPRYYRLALWQRTLEQRVGVDSNNATHWLLRVQAPIDPGLARVTIRNLVARHQAFRTVFEDRHGLPHLRLIEDDFDLPICVESLSGNRAAAPEAEARALVGNWLWRELPIGDGPHWRMLCLKLGPEDWVLGCVLHHLVADGQSMTVLAGDFFRNYAQLLFKPEAPSWIAPAVGGLDFFGATEEWLLTDAGRAALSHWMAHLGDSESIPPLAPETLDEEPCFALDEFEVAPSIVERVKDLGRKHGATPFITLIALQYLLLREMFSVYDLTIGAVIANRDFRPLANAVGFLADRTFYRVVLPPTATLSDIVARLLEERRISWAYRHCPSDLIKRELTLVGQPIVAPSFNYTPLHRLGLSDDRATSAFAAPFAPPPPPSSTPPAQDMPYRLVVTESVTGWRFRFWVSRPDMIEAAPRFKALLESFSG